MKPKQDFVTHLTQNLQDNLPISDYSNVYLKKIIHDIHYYVSIYHEICKTIEAVTEQKISQLTCIDYGGGTGLLSCYLVWQGAAAVYYVDIFEPASKDAFIIAEKLNLNAKTYIVGNESTIHVKADVLVSMDVIEHIYDLTAFFENIKSFNADLVQVHVTGANTYNPIVKRKLQKVHLTNEFVNKTPPLGAKPSDNYRAYYELRSEWIQKKYGHKLIESEIKALAERTRGLIFDDIDRLIHNYLKTKVLPPFPNHKTNTCNPYTGNWSERLLTHKELESYILPLGWELNINTIGYNQFNKPLHKKIPILLLNFIANLFPQLSKYWQPLLKFTIK